MKRHLLVPTNRADLQLALDSLKAAGIDAKAHNWNPEVATNPPARAGITVQQGEIEKSRQILDIEKIPFIELGAVTP
jgi:hypothetical protein